MVTLWFGLAEAASVDDFRACADGDVARCRALGVELRSTSDPRAWQVLERACELGSAESCADLVQVNHRDPEIAVRSCAAGHAEVCAWLGEWKPGWACVHGIQAGCDAQMAGVRAGPVVTDAAFLDRHQRLDGIAVAADRGLLFVDGGDAVTVTHVDPALGVHRVAELRPVALSLRLATPAPYAAGSRLEMVLEQRDGERRLLVVEPGGSRVLPVDRRVCRIREDGWAMVDPAGACEPSRWRYGHQVDGKVAGVPLPAIPRDRKLRAGVLLGDTLAAGSADEVVLWGAGGELRRRTAPSLAGFAVAGDDLLVSFEGADPRWERWDGATLATVWSAPSPGSGRGVAESPDGRWIAAGGEALALYDASTGLVAQTTRVPCAAPLWDGRGDLWCAGGDSVVRLTAGAGTAERPPSDPAAWATPAGWSEAFTGVAMSVTVRGEGRPVAGARVKIGAFDAGTTDASGRWRAGVSGPLAVLEVDAPGFVVWRGQVEVAGPHDLELTPAVSVSYRLDPPPDPAAEPPRVGVDCPRDEQGPSGSGPTMARLPRGADCRAHAMGSGRVWTASFRAEPGASVVLSDAAVAVDPRPTARVQVLDAFGAPIAGVGAGGRTSDAQGWLDLAEPGTDDALDLPGADPLDVDVAWRERRGEWTAYVDGVAVTVPDAAGVKWVGRGTAVVGLSPRPGDDPDPSVVWARPGDALVLLVLDDGRPSRSELTVDAHHRAFPAPAPATEVLQVDFVGMGGLPEIGRDVQIGWRERAWVMGVETDLAGRIRVPTPYRGAHAVSAGGGATVSVEPNVPTVVDVRERPTSREPMWAARPGPFGLRVWLARPEVRVAGPTWDDVVVEACGQDVRSWTWEDLSDALTDAGGCDGAVLRDHDRVPLRLPPP